MRSLIKGRSMTIAVAVAVLVPAVVGSAIAATSGSTAAKKKKIRGNLIAKNSIPPNRLKKNIPGGKIKAGSITGLQVNASTLGTVPSATTAVSAASATNALALQGNSPSAFVSMTAQHQIGPLTLENNQQQQVYTRGPLSLTAQCKINQVINTVAAQDSSRILIATTQDNAVFDASDSSAALTTATAEDSREFVATMQATGTAGVDHESDAMAVAPDGTGIWMEALATVNAVGFGGAGKCYLMGRVYDMP